MPNGETGAVQVSVKLPAFLHRQVERQAHAEGLSPCQLIVRAVSQELDSSTATLVRAPCKEGAPNTKSRHVTEFPKRN
jgi:hypothetical protein